MNTAADSYTATRTELRLARHAPGGFYSAPELYRRAVTECFLRDWLFVAREEELANPGDYMALRPVDQPIVIARDLDGTLHAFYNMCAHRGVEVASGEGNTRAFNCPYHGWSYDLAGRLTGAAYMKDSPGFDVANCRMKPLRLGVWGGNIFVSFDPDGPSLDSFVADFAGDFDVFRMQDCRLGNKISIELDCNWKLANENLMDFYHVSVLHAKTFGNRVSWETQAMHLLGSGGYIMEYKAQPSAPGGKFLLGKLPWLADAPEGFARCGLLPPNFTLYGRLDAIRPFVVWPLGVDRCRLDVYHLFPKEFFDRPDFAEAMATYREYQIAVLEEDRSMILSLQRAMASEAFAPGRMSVAEKPIHHYIATHLARMFGEEDTTG